MSDSPTLKVKEIKGVKELGDRLMQLEGKIAVRIQKDSLKRGAEALRWAAQEAAPMGETGNLKAGFVVRVSKRKDSVTAQVINTAPHAHLVEYGHRMIGPKPNKKDSGKRTRAHPFMRKALDLLAEKVEQMIVEDLRKELDNAQE